VLHSSWPHGSKHSNVPAQERKTHRDRRKSGRRLTTETVEGTALALESVDNVERGDGLALGVLSVGDGVTDDALKEGLQDTTGLFVDHWAALVMVRQCIGEGGVTYWQRYA
jgi:hypothetical protein